MIIDPLGHGSRLSSNFADYTLGSSAHSLIAFLQLKEILSFSNCLLLTHQVIFSQELFQGSIQAEENDESNLNSFQSPYPEDEEVVEFGAQLNTLSHKVKEGFMIQQLSEDDRNSLRSELIYDALQYWQSNPDLVAIYLREYVHPNFVLSYQERSPELRIQSRVKEIFLDPSNSPSLSQVYILANLLPAGFLETNSAIDSLTKIAIASLYHENGIAELVSLIANPRFAVFASHLSRNSEFQEFLIERAPQIILDYHDSRWGDMLPKNLSFLMHACNLDLFFKSTEFFSSLASVLTVHIQFGEMTSLKDWLSLLTAPNHSSRDFFNANCQFLESLSGVIEARILDDLADPSVTLTPEIFILINYCTSPEFKASLVFENSVRFGVLARMKTLIDPSAMKDLLYLLPEQKRSVFCLHEGTNRGISIYFATMHNLYETAINRLVQERKNQLTDVNSSSIGTPLPSKMVLINRQLPDPISYTRLESKLFTIREKHDQLKELAANFDHTILDLDLNQISFILKRIGTDQGYQKSPDLKLLTLSAHPSVNINTLKISISTWSRNFNTGLRLKADNLEYARLYFEECLESAQRISAPQHFKNICKADALAELAQIESSPSCVEKMLGALKIYISTLPVHSEKIIRTLELLRERAAKLYENEKYELITKIVSTLKKLNTARASFYFDPSEERREHLHLLKNIAFKQFNSLQYSGILGISITEISSAFKKLDF